MRTLLVTSLLLSVACDDYSAPVKDPLTCTDVAQITCDRAIECGAVQESDRSSCEDFNYSICDSFPEPCQYEPDEYTCEIMAAGTWWHCLLRPDTDTVGSF